MIFKKKETLAASIDGPEDTTKILALVAEDYIKEKRSKRRWGLIIKALIAAYILGIIWVTLKGAGVGGGAGLTTSHVALVRINGTIGQGFESIASNINDSLRDAFENKAAKAVILKLNSPGGTPVHSDLVYREIKRLRSEYPDKEVIAVIDNVCASGCYYIAAAADEIIANPASIVGSIGVRMGGFGFTEAMKKFGVERRLITSGDNKGMLDPFSPVNQSEISHAETMLSQVHQQFIDAVKDGRGDRLVETEGMFSGLFWSGEEAKRIGLVDSFGIVGRRS